MYQRTRGRWIFGLLRIVYLSALFLGLLGPVAAYFAVPGYAQSGQPHVYALTFQGAVTPVLREYLGDGIEAAQASGAEAVILQLDTPGGSVDVTKQINQLILGSSIPVIVYVSPSGAQAGSAGTFITLAAHVAVMAPGSSIGAASPVSAGGEEVGDTMMAKVVNILSADIENLAERRGERAVEWAIAAVQEAAAATANQALEIGIIDFIARDLADLLNQTDGFTVTVQGREQVLNTGDALVRPIDMNPIQQFLNFIANPQVATILLTLGSVGLIAELYNPGTFVPGSIGLVSLLLGLYALGQLDANFTGLALIVLALILFVGEAVTPTFGALAVGGAISFVFGSVLLFDAPGLSVPWPTIIGLATFMTLFAIFAGGKGLSAQRRRPHSGSEGIIGRRAVVRVAFDEQGHGRVFLDGELWNANFTGQGTPPAQGEHVTITAREGFTLTVQEEKVTA